MFYLGSFLTIMENFYGASTLTLKVPPSLSTDPFISPPLSPTQDLNVSIAPERRSVLQSFPSEASFSCHVCKRGFFSIEALNIHRGQKSESATSFNFSSCPLSSTTMPSSDTSSASSSSPQRICTCRISPVTCNLHSPAESLPVWSPPRSPIASESSFNFPHVTTRDSIHDLAEPIFPDPISYCF